jgi:cysteine desulfurase/selenocysteine lyase
MLDVARIREDFPILAREVNGRPLVYLDNAATTQKPRQVIDALVRYYENSNANIHRGIHTLSVEATDQYEGVRDKVATLIGAGDRHEIVFTRNTSESINLVAYAWGLASLRQGDEILLSRMEHHSNIVPWQLVAGRTGAVVRYLDFDEEGRLSLADLRIALSGRTKVVSLVHVSNALGTINPIADIGEEVRRAGALFIVDGAQSAPHLSIDVQSLNCDLFAFSAHKMLGPTGVGVLWGRGELLEAMDPFLGGGEMISVVREERSTWADVPHKFEAGTPNIADVIAFGAAVDYLKDVGMDNVREHELDLTAYAVDRLQASEVVGIYGPSHPSERSGVVPFNVTGVHPHDVSSLLDAQGIAIRAGHHCAQLAVRRLGVPATSRASFYLYNTRDEVDALVAAVRDAAAFFSRNDARTAV